MTQTYQDYFDALGFRESSSVPGGTQRYNTENSAGFIGKYQFGEAALFDLGYYATDNSDNNLFKNDWSGHWSGKNGINSLQDYLNNGTVQEMIVREWHELLWQRMKFLELDIYEGQILNGQTITLSGMLATAHLLGPGSQSSDTAGLKGYLLSGAVFSPQDGNGTTAHAYMDLFADFAAPFAIDHSQDEIITGGSGDDILTGLGGNDTLTGNEGIDTAVYDNSAFHYTLTNRPDTSWSIQHNNTGADGSDILFDIERIQFGDMSLALDLDGNAGLVAKIIGAVSGPASLSNQELVGIGLNLLDDGMHYETLMALAINAVLGAEAINPTEVVNLLYENIVGVTPTATEAAPFVALLNSGSQTVSSFGVLAAETLLNQENINLVGLSQHGIEYSPVSI